MFATYWNVLPFLATSGEPSKAASDAARLIPGGGAVGAPEPAVRVAQSSTTPMAAKQLSQA